MPPSPKPVQLGYTQLHAEFDGVVTATSGEIGQVVSAGQTVVTIARPEVRDVVVDVPQFAAQRLDIGSTFDIALQLDPKIRTTGVVREIAPEAETATRTRRTKISLQDAPPTFRLGSVVTASAIAASESQIMLPSSALLKPKTVGVSDRQYRYGHGHLAPGQNRGRAR